MAQNIKSQTLQLQIKSHPIPSTSVFRNSLFPYVCARSLEFSQTWTVFSHGPSVHLIFSPQNYWLYCAYLLNSYSWNCQKTTPFRKFSITLIISNATLVIKTPIVLISSNDMNTFLTYTVVTFVNSGVFFGHTSTAYRICSLTRIQPAPSAVKAHTGPPENFPVK